MTSSNHCLFCLDFLAYAEHITVPHCRHKYHKDCFILNGYKCLECAMNPRLAQCANCLGYDTEITVESMCPRCFETYCCEECRDAHWESTSNSHKLYCIPICTNCGEQEPVRKAFKKCGRCRKSMYCSRECQRTDWYCHKDYCSVPENT